MIFTSGKAKSWPSRHNLHVYQLLSTVRLSPSQLQPPRYNFYKRKSEKLAVASQSVSIPAALYGTSGSKPAATIFAGEKAKTAKYILNRKSLLLAHLLLPPGYDFYERKSEKLAVASQSA